MTKRTFSTPFRRLYLFRFVFRCVVFAASVLLYVRSPQPLTALQGFGFFHSFTLLHLLWLLWMADMVSQLCRCRWYWSEGLQKFLDRSVLPPQRGRPRRAAALCAGKQPPRRGHGCGLAGRDAGGGRAVSGRLHRCGHGHAHFRVFLCV